MFGGWSLLSTEDNNRVRQWPVAPWWSGVWGGSDRGWDGLTLSLSLYFVITYLELLAGLGGV